MPLISENTTAEPLQKTGFMIPCYPSTVSGSSKAKRKYVDPQSSISNTEDKATLATTASLQRQVGTLAPPSTTTAAPNPSRPETGLSHHLGSFPPKKLFFPRLLRARPSAKTLVHVKAAERTPSRRTVTSPTTLSRTAKQSYVSTPPTGTPIWKRK